MPRGGNRRKGEGTRPNLQLTRAQCYQLFQAAQNAIDAGQPFNRSITIIWGRFHDDDIRNREFTEGWLELARRWCTSRGHKLRYIGVQEWGPVNKAHVHILLHIPPELFPEYRYCRLPSKWAKTVLGKNQVPKITASDTLSPPQTKAADNGLYEQKLHRILHYMMKCAPKSCESEFDFCEISKQPWGQNSRCYGKRIFVSQ